jgi:hypothetical protein
LGLVSNMGISELMREPDGWRALRLHEVPTSVSGL